LESAFAALRRRDRASRLKTVGIRVAETHWIPLFDENTMLDFPHTPHARHRRVLSVASVRESPHFEAYIDAPR
jgi:hypothetical protein